MPTKWGRVVSWGKTDPKFVQAYLESGEKVELPLSLRDHMIATYSPNEALVFVERRGRLFRFVQWVGRPGEAVEAVAAGILRDDEVPGFVAAAGRMVLGAAAQPAQDAFERKDQALSWIADLLGDDAPNDLDVFGRVIDRLIELSENELERIRRRYEDSLHREQMNAFSLLSSDALRVGFSVRWVRWPNPKDDDANDQFRMNMDTAALAFEAAVAGLAEPSLARGQVELLWSPLEAAVPLDSIR